MAVGPRSSGRAYAVRRIGRGKGPGRVRAAGPLGVSVACLALAVGVALSPGGASAWAAERPQLAQTFLKERTLKEAPAFIVKRYRREAVAGDARAQFYLGLMHEQGLIGETPDLEAARDWYLEAARGGYPPAQYKAGIFLENGRGGARDAARAADFYRRAAERGLKEAQYNYGLMLARGRGTGRDVRAAIPWLERAALAGMTQAALSLAELHTAGVGTPVDPVEAWAWLKRAADAGNAEARRLLDELEPQMTADQRAEARRLEQAHDALARPAE